MSPTGTIDDVIPAKAGNQLNGLVPGFRRGDGGFTLIELAFVAFLFALFASLAAAQFRRSYDSLSSRSGLQDVLGLMAMARERSVLERAYYGVRLDPAENAYWLVRGQDNSRVIGQWGVRHALPACLTYEGAETTVGFGPNGTATAATLLFKERENAVTLTIDPVTGKGSVL